MIKEGVFWGQDSVVTVTVEFKWLESAALVKDLVGCLAQAGCLLLPKMKQVPTLPLPFPFLFPSCGFFLKTEPDSCLLFHIQDTIST